MNTYTIIMYVLLGLMTLGLCILLILVILGIRKTQWKD